MKKIIVLSLTLLMVCLCLSGCGAGGPDIEKVQTKYVAYCSLNDAETGTEVLSVEDARDIAWKVITDRGLGYTEYMTYGGFVDGETINGNDTLVYTFFFIEKSDADAVAAEIKEELNLASVLMEEISCTYDFLP